jgi:hypothetical protein
LLAFPPLAALALALALVMQASAAPVIETNFHVPVSIVGTHPCTGATITISGDDHIQAQVSRDEGTAGIGVHAHVHQNAHLTGTDDQGTSYIGNEADELLINGRVDADGQIVQQEETSILDNVVLVSQGTAPNLRVKITVHVTLNPNGTITAVVDHLTMTCQG